MFPIDPGKTGLDRFYKHYQSVKIEFEMQVIFGGLYEVDQVAGKLVDTVS